MEFIFALQKTKEFFFLKIVTATHLNLQKRQASITILLNGISNPLCMAEFTKNSSFLISQTKLLLLLILPHMGRNKCEKLYHPLFTLLLLRQHYRNIKTISISTYMTHTHTHISYNNNNYQQRQHSVSTKNIYIYIISFPV